jgi:CrcB protein
MTILLVAGFGGLGAVSRWLVDLGLAARFGRTLPWGTIAVNILGSCVAGGLAGAAAGAHLGTSSVEVLAVGFCGGLTTFSAASFDVAREIERRRPGLGALLFTVPMVLAVSFGILSFHAFGG